MISKKQTVAFYQKQNYNKPMKIKLFILLSLYPLSIMAKEHIIKQKDSSIIMELDDSWLYLENVLGVPHLFLSNTNKPKDSISVTNTNLKNFKLNASQLKDKYEDYKKGRNSWAKKNNITINEFYPYKNYKKSNVDIHHAGFEYKNEGSIFSENSFYIECKTDFFHIKSTVLKIRHQSEQQALKAITELQCR